MTDKNKKIFNVIDGSKRPSVRERFNFDSVTDEIMQEVHVATWRLSTATDHSEWTPSNPGWLPAEATQSAAKFIEFLHPEDKKFFHQSLYDLEQTGFETQLRLRFSDKQETWLHINARRDSADPSNVVLVVRDASAMKSLQTTLQQQIRRHQEMARDTEAIAFEANLPDWSVRHIDRQIEAMLGYPTADWLRRKDFLQHNTFSEDWKNFSNLLEKRESDNERFAFDFRIKNANGELRWLRCAGRHVPAGKISPPRVRGVFQDVSESRMAIEERNISEKQLNILYDQNPSMFFSMNTEGLILSVNRYGADHLGYRREELIGRSAEEIHLPSQRSSVRELFTECLDANGLVSHWETCLTRKDGAPLWVRVAARAITQSNQRGILVVCEDITETRALSDKLEYQSRFDLLTGLANRTSYEASLNEALVSARENKWEHVLCYLDLDQFKIVNDTCGHSAGDQMLRRVGRMLARYLREEDILARLGGDEFGILFHRCDLDNARRRAEEINNYLASCRFKWADNKFRITSSIGMVAITRGSSSTEQLLSIADTACYAAKDAGRNRVYCYQEDDVEITRRHGEMSWVARLQDALDHDGFEIYSQIIQPLDPSKDDKVSIEILLRLTDDEGDIILPERFIKAAENYNIATRLDSWVCEHVIEFFKEQPKYLRSLNFVCVNLSSQSVTDGEFQQHLMKILDKQDHIAEKLCFEITETGVIENLEAATEFIRSLKSLGCRFALDDFGSGVSSFAYLKNLEVDIVKIDGMFVKQMVDDPIDQALVSSINEIGHAMGKKTIAEFVEDEDTQRCLKQLGVDYAQGYHIHKPQPLNDQLKSVS